ncbi:MAG: type I phosphomannose isomerase catalytic subunit [Verrucomicrobiales bacterium]
MVSQAPPALYPLCFKPLFQERIWGGRTLETLYAKPLPPGKQIGESWEVCDRPDVSSEIINGPLAGRPLSWMMQNHRQELLGSGRDYNGRYPLLIKILDARDKLSLQVHPPAIKAAGMGGEPKTEMWHITQAEDNAELYVGLKKGVTPDQFASGIEDGSVAECFHRIPVKAGDTMFLPSGRVHAIGAGLVIFEIQQNSDTTYRVFDWNRVDASGKGRELHVRQSLECIDFNDHEPTLVAAPPQAIPSQVSAQPLVEDDLFRVELVETHGEAHLDYSVRHSRVIGCVTGELEIHHFRHPVTITAGQFCLIPAEMQRAAITCKTASTFLVAEPG